MTIKTSYEIIQALPKFNPRILRNSLPTEKENPMAKKYLNDSILPNVATDATVIGGNIAACIAAVMEAEGERFANEPLPIYSNVPQTTENANDPENPIVNWQFGQDDAGEIVFQIAPETETAFTSSQVVAVAVWHDEETATIPQAEGEPLKSLKALYILALPTIAQMRGNAKLTAYIDSLLAKDTLGKARVIARKLASGADGYTLVADPIGMFLSATASAASRESAFNKMWSFAQAYMLKVADATIQAQKAAGKHGAAAVVKATYSRTRLSKDVLKACFSSQMAAEHHFPQMVNTNEERGARGMQWDNILRMMISQAPKFRTRKAVKDENGEVVKDAEGKTVYEAVPAAQSPAIFAYWLENRYATEAVVSDEEEIEIDFGAVDL